MAMDERDRMELMAEALGVAASKTWKVRRLKFGRNHTDQIGVSQVTDVFIGIVLGTPRHIALKEPSDSSYAVSMVTELLKSAGLIKYDRLWLQGRKVHHATDAGEALSRRMGVDRWKDPANAQE